MGTSTPIGNLPRRENRGGFLISPRWVEGSGNRFSIVGVFFPPMPRPVF